MTRLSRQRGPQTIRVVFGLALLGIFFVELRQSSPLAGTLLPAPPIVYARATTVDPWEEETFESLIRLDPLRALEAAREDFNRTRRDYTCTFIKQELLPSGISEEQMIRVKFRAEPFSVLMHWIRNADKAERVLYVKGRWRNEQSGSPEESELAVCQPGPIARVFVRSIKQPIHGRLARTTSRRFIDEFGLLSTFDLLIKYCQTAKQNGELALEYVGESEIDGRPTWMLERRLPYTGPKGFYPDRVAVIHIDQAWRVPVSVRCYSDDAGQALLGHYEYRDLDFNALLTESDFDPDTYDM
jgi:hypothetical protein